MRALAELRRRGRAQGERGQVLPLTAVMLVALLIVVAIVVDMGTGRENRRNAQNAADAGALAAVKELRDTRTSGMTYADRVDAAEQKALEYASAHGFNAVLCDPDNGVTDDCIEVNAAPTQGQYGPDDPSDPSSVGDKECVEVIPHGETAAFFGKLTADDSIEVTARAVACFKPTTNGAYALYASGSCDGALSVSESASDGGAIDVQGAIHSSGGVKLNNTGVSGQVTAEGDVDLSTQSSAPNGTSGSNSDPVDPPLLFDIDDWRPAGAFDDPDVPGTPGHIQSILGSDYHDYSGQTGWSTNDIVQPGVYYFDGNMSIGNFVTAWGVTVIAEGSIHANGQRVTHTAFDMTPYLDDDYYTGGIPNGIMPWEKNFLAVSWDEDNCGNTNAIQYNGSNVFAKGFLYAPNGGCSFSTADGTLIGAIVCESIDVSLSSASVLWDPENELWIPQNNLRE